MVRIFVIVVIMACTIGAGARRVLQGGQPAASGSAGMCTTVNLGDIQYGAGYCANSLIPSSSCAALNAAPGDNPCNLACEINFCAFCSASNGSERVSHNEWN
jgi:hypothetical protein